MIINVMICSRRELTFYLLRRKVLRKINISDISSDFVGEAAIAPHFFKYLLIYFEFNCSE